MVTRETPLEIGSLEELEGVLLKIWPQGSVTRDELFQGLGIEMPLERNIIIGKLGVWKTRWAVSDVARLFWSRSNYADDTKREDPLEPSQQTPTRGRSSGTPPDQARRSLRGEVGAMARVHPGEPNKLKRLVSIACRMARALEEIDRAAQPAGETPAAEDATRIGTLLAEWHAWRGDLL